MYIVQQPIITQVKLGKLNYKKRTGTKTTFCENLLAVAGVVKHKEAVLFKDRVNITSIDELQYEKSEDILEHLQCNQDEATNIGEKIL